MKLKNFSSSAVAVLTIALGGVGLSAVSAMTPLTQSAQSQTYLPFPKGKSYQVTQSWQSPPPGSHSANAKFAYTNQYGVDFGMPINSEVAAVRPGKVIHAWSGGSQRARGCNPDYADNANYVVIDHNDGKSSIYLHLNAVRVKAGDSVKQGQIIGLSGDTGYSCGAHLHFGFQNTTSRVYGNSIPVGFVETGNGKPVQGRTYASQNPGSSSSITTGIKLLVSKATGRSLDAGGGNYSLYMHPTPITGNSSINGDLNLSMAALST